MGAIPRFDTPMSYQAQCGVDDCGKLIGMSYRYCPGCGTEIDWPEVDEDADGTDVPRHLLTGGDR